MKRHLGGSGASAIEKARLTCEVYLMAVDKSGRPFQPRTSETDGMVADERERAA
jgi:hypothetical protein